MNYQAVIVAAGQGSRMGSNQNKVLLPLHSEPVIIHTLRVFDQDPSCRKIVLVVQNAEYHTFRSLIETYGITKKIDFAPGGAERQESVYHGLLALEDSDPDSIVLIHDGARPFVTRRGIAETAKQAYEYGAALLAVPVKDTIKQVDGQGQVADTPDRKSLWAAQTPQAFRLSLILRAHRAKTNHPFGATDDASLVEHLDLPVKVVMGSYRNIKLTTPEDMVVAEKFFEEEENNHAGWPRI